MFSVRQKREISAKIQNILRSTNHPELPEGSITFTLNVSGKEVWSWAVIKNNSAVKSPNINIHNELMDLEANGKPNNSELPKSSEGARTEGVNKGEQITCLESLKKAVNSLNKNECKRELSDFQSIGNLFGVKVVVNKILPDDTMFVSENIFRQILEKTNQR